MSLINAKQGADEGPERSSINIRNTDLTLKFVNTVDEMFT